MMILKIFIKTAEKYLQENCVYDLFKFTWVKMKYFKVQLSIALHVKTYLMPFIGFTNTNCVSAYTLRRKNYFYGQFENLIHYIDPMSGKFFFH